MNKTLMLASVASIALIFGAETQAQAQDKTMHDAMHGNTSAATNHFVAAATVGNEFEIETSQLALDRSNSESVKNFAQMMIDDHKQALEGLKEAAPTDVDPMLMQARLDAAHQKKFDWLKNAPDKDFDADYIAVQRAAHKEAYGAYASYAKNGDEKDLRDYARTTLPTIKSHVQHISEMVPQRDAMKPL